jgi:hypothetical protein
MRLPVCAGTASRALTRSADGDQHRQCERVPPRGPVAQVGQHDRHHHEQDRQERRQVPARRPLLVADLGQVGGQPEAADDHRSRPGAVQVAGGQQLPKAGHSHPIGENFRNPSLPVSEG